MLWVIFIKIQMLVPMIDITYCKMKRNSSIRFNFYKPVILLWYWLLIFFCVIRSRGTNTLHQTWDYKHCCVFGSQ